MNAPPKLTETRTRELALYVTVDDGARKVIVATLHSRARPDQAFPEPQVTLTMMPFGDAPTRAQWNVIVDAVKNGLDDWAARWPETWWEP